MKARLLTLLGLMLLIFNTLEARTHSYHFRHYTVENGLSSNIVRSILQDKRGFLWIGTEEGLNRFDGQNIKTYLSNTNTNSTLGNNYINVLFEDTEGKLWIGTDIGIFLYDYEKDLFHPLNVKTKQGTSILSVVNNIVQDKQRNIWMSTYGQGVFRYNQDTQKLTQYLFPGTQQNQVSFVLTDTDDQVWISSRDLNQPLARFSRSRNRFEPYTLRLNPEDKPSPIYHMLENSEGELLLGTWNDGVRKLDRNTGKTTTWLSPRKKGGILHIHSMYELSPSELMVGSDDGLSILNTQTGEHQLITPEEGNPTGLTNKFIYPIVKDKEGGLWIGTYYGGVNYISPSNGLFKGYTKSSLRNSVSGNIISRFCEDNEGKIWIGTDDGGLNRYDPKTGQFKRYLPEPGKNSLTYHNVHALCVNGDELWIGTYTGGLDVLNLKTGRFRNYYTYEKNPRTLDGSSVYAIYRDREKRMWVTSMTGVNLYQPATDDFLRVKNFGYMTIDIVQDKTGDLWFATQGNGLYRHNPTRKTWKHYTHKAGKENSLANNQVNCLCLDDKKELWIGTGDGLCKYNPATDAFTTIELPIPSNNICSILESDGLYWITTSRGLVRYNPREKGDARCQIFTQSDGLQSNQFIFNSGLKSSTGELYVGTLNGFNTFTPSKIRRNVFSPPVVITDLEIFNKQVPIEEKGKLPRKLCCMDRLDLSYRDDVFSLRYAALSYNTPEKNQYAYQLVGFDDDWNYVGTQTKATYTNLPAGTYTFKVKASNNDGVWNEAGAQLKIVIHPPFYLTFPFKVLYVLLALWLVYALYRWQTRRAEQKHREHLLEVQQEKEREVYQSKIEFFTMIAHEIRTPVSLIIGPVEKLLSGESASPENTKRDLGIVERNSQRLLTLVNQLLDFRKAEEGGFTLSFRKYRLSSILEGIYDRFRPNMEQRGIAFVTDGPDPELEAVIDAEAITKMVSNLLTNALKFTRDRVEVKAFREDTEFVLTVTDNGCGISSENQEKIFQPFYQVAAGTKPGTGIGLSIVKSVVDAHQGSISLRSETDLGSAFTVRIPLQREGWTLPETDANLEGEIRPEQTEPDAANLWSDRKKRRLLVVDDNEEMIHFLADSFLDEFQVLTAKDGVEALDVLRKDAVDLIITDLMMPRMDGLEFTGKVHSDPMYSHIPIVLLTAKTDVNSKIEGMNVGADAYVEKPFSIQYLRACVHNLLATRELLRRKFSEMPFVPLKSIASNKVEEEFLAKMNEIIAANISNVDFSVDVLAQELCISRSGLFAKIKTLADVTPNELIQLMRLKKAAELLSEGHMRINEVAYQVGFNNPSYFSKCFQKQFGVKPMEFLHRKS